MNGEINEQLYWNAAAMEKFAAELAAAARWDAAAAAGAAVPKLLDMEAVERMLAQAEAWLRRTTAVGTARVLLSDYDTGDRASRLPPAA